ncbi:hypothetical protein D8674_000494 [Pyrus ussuriensis x Pyrus communis]|uniref:Uncharacterized protein n=1 Tax=Pyrus ussuriensis x Pyrus communis TaxID=2448454 RepID=A0A5N5FGR8_9ROSA|nr:hypothetical protein D8674_000494 [Pyrus ussuriensis x Pyrus communis]
MDPKSVNLVDSVDLVGPRVSHALASSASLVVLPISARRGHHRPRTPDTTSASTTNAGVTTRIEEVDLLGLLSATVPFWLLQFPNTSSESKSLTSNSSDVVSFSSMMPNLWTTLGGGKEGGGESSRGGARVSFTRAERLKGLSRLGEMEKAVHALRVVVVKKRSHCNSSDQCFPR